MKSHIAVFLHTVDSFFIPQEYRESTYGIVAENSPLLTFAKSNFSEEKLIVVPMYSANGTDLSEKKILYNKKLLETLKEKRVTHLVIPHHCTKIMKNWASTYGIRLIGTPFEQQQKMENKLYFDKLLKRNTISSPPTVTDLSMYAENTSFVVQQALSYGLFGTKFCSTKKEVKKILKSSKHKMLIREYNEGISIGVSIFIDHKKNYFFSSFRRQCFTYRDGFPNTFLGIQWLPKNFFSKSTTQKTYELLQKLADILIAQKFVGIANIDILIHNELPYILECNPRLSSATAHVFSVGQLSAYPDPYGFFLNTFLNRNNDPVIRTIPFSTYEGCSLDIDIKKACKIKKLLPIGVYELQNNTLQFIGSDLNLRKGKNRFFMLHYLAKTGTIKNTELCTIISDKPLYESHGGHLTAEGEKVYTAFYNAFLGK